MRVHCGPYSPFAFFALALLIALKWGNSTIFDFVSDWVVGTRVGPTVHVGSIISVRDSAIFFDAVGENLLPIVLLERSDEWHKFRVKNEAAEDSDGKENNSWTEFHFELFNLRILVNKL
jgi:hypothetical protein